MAKKTVPAYEIFTCDSCGTDGLGHMEEGVVQIERNSRDYQGAVVARPKKKLELCDKCLSRITNAINETITRIRMGKQYGREPD